MDRLLQAIIDAHYDKCVSRVIHRLRRISSRDWQGDHAPMRNLWDHWKLEMQNEHSLVHEMLENAVRAEVSLVIKKLPHEAGALMTLATDALDDLEEDPGTPVFAPDAVAAKLMGRVNSRACVEPHRREVQRCLDEIERDRFELDNETNRYDR